MSNSKHIFGLFVKNVNKFTENAKVYYEGGVNLFTPILPPEVDYLKQNSLRNRSADEQLSNDAIQWDAYLHSKDERAASKEKKLIMARIFTIIQHCGLQAANDHPTDCSLNLASVLSHGGRLVIQVPKITDANEDPNRLLDAILGDKNKKGEQGVFYARPFASHTLNVEGDRVNEGLLKTTGLDGDYALLLKDKFNKRHFGMDIGVGYAGVMPEDGSHGHVYLYWLAPTLQSPGGLMIGVETAAPGKTNPYGTIHGASALKGEFTPTGGTKFSSEPFAAHREAGLILSHEGGLRVDIKPEDFNTVLTVVNDTKIENMTVDVLQQNVEIKNKLNKKEESSLSS